LRRNLITHKRGRVHGKKKTTELDPQIAGQYAIVETVRRMMQLEVSK